MSPSKQTSYANESACKIYLSVVAGIFNGTGIKPDARSYHCTLS
ncbi:hypothetical protein [Undibacterium sp. Ren11W]